MENKTDVINDRVRKSLELVNWAKQFAPKNPHCKVEYLVDDAGAISAHVYGEKSVGFAELCLNDGRLGKQGAYMLRAAFMNPDRIIDVYATYVAKVPHDTVKTNSNDFINWLNTLRNANAVWEATNVAWDGGFYEVYQTQKDALSALSNGDVLRLDPYGKKINQNIDDGRTM